MVSQRPNTFTMIGLRSFASVLPITHHVTMVPVIIMMTCSYLLFIVWGYHNFKFTA